VTRLRVSSVCMQQGLTLCKGGVLGVQICYKRCEGPSTSFSRVVDCETWVQEENQVGKVLKCVHRECRKDIQCRVVTTALLSRLRQGGVMT
jgi:hypothetical protein